MSEDVVAALDAELALIEQLPYRVPIHRLAKRARDEIAALRAKCIELSADRTRQLVADRRAKVLEEAVRAIDDIAWDWPSPWIDDAEAFKATLRALKER